MSVSEALEKAVEDSKNKWTAIYIALLAVLLAICSIGDDDASKTAVRANIQAANTYAFFQAKNIRQTGYEIAADQFRLSLLDPNLSEEARQYLNDKIAAYDATVNAMTASRKRVRAKKSCCPKRGIGKRNAISP